MSLFKLNESAGSGFVEGIRWMGCNFNSVRGWVSRQTFSLTGHGSVFKPHTTDKQSVVYMLPAPLAEHLLVFVEVGIKAVPTFDVASLAVLPWGSIEASRAADIYAVSRYILTDQRRVVVDFSPCGLDERLIGADEIRIIKLVPHQAVLAIPERYMDPPLGSSRASCSAYYASELVVYEADQLCDLDLSDSPVRSPITCTCDKAADKSADKSVEATTACNTDKPVTAKPVTAKSAVPPAFSWDSTNAQQTLDQAIAAWKQQLGALPDMLLDLTAISRSTEKPATDKSRLAASASWDSNDAQKTLEQVINAWRQQLDSLQDIFVDFNVVSYSAANLSFQWTGDNFSALMKWLRGCTFFDTERGVFKGSPQHDRAESSVAIFPFAYSTESALLLVQIDLDEALRGSTEDTMKTIAVVQKGEFLFCPNVISRHKGGLFYIDELVVRSADTSCCKRNKVTRKLLAEEVEDSTIH